MKIKKVEIRENGHLLVAILKNGKEKIIRSIKMDKIQTLDWEIKEIKIFRKLSILFKKEIVCDVLEKIKEYENDYELIVRAHYTSISYELLTAVLENNKIYFIEQLHPLFGSGLRTMIYKDRELVCKLICFDLNTLEEIILTQTIKGKNWLFKELIFKPKTIKIKLIFDGDPDTVDYDEVARQINQKKQKK